MLLRPPSQEFTLSSNPEQWVSALGIIEAKLREGKNTVLISQTNTGKTEACFKALKKTNTKFIFAVDCKLLADQLAKRYDLPAYYKGKEKPNGSCITLYNHVAFFKDEATVLFVDEFHNIIKDYGYKRDVIDLMLQSFKSYKQVLGLTGTPLADMDGFESIKIIKPQTDRIINHIQVDIESHLIYNIISNPNKVHYISLFDKATSCANIISNLIKNGLEEDQITTINAETKGSSEYLQLVNEQQVKDKKVIITTYTQGFNISGKDYVLHIMPQGKASHSPEDIEQVVNRFRDKLPELYFYCELKPGTESFFDVVQHHKDIIKKANDKLGWGRKNLNFSPGKMDDTHNRVMNGLIDTEFENLVTVDFKLNTIQIAHLVYKKRTEELYKNYLLMQDSLKQYGYNLRDIAANPNRVKYSNDDIYESLIKVREARYKEQVDEIYRSSSYILQANDELSRKFSLLVNHTISPEDTRDILKNILFDKRKWNKLLDQLAVLKPTTALERYIVEHIYASFEVGQKYTSDDIQQKLDAIYQKNDLANMTSTLSTQALKKYFSIRRGKNSERENAYKILSRISVASIVKENLIVRVSKKLSVICTI